MKIVILHYKNTWRCKFMDLLNFLTYILQYIKFYVKQTIVHLSRPWSVDGRVYNFLTQNGELKSAIKQNGELGCSKIKIQLYKDISLCSPFHPLEWQFGKSLLILDHEQRLLIHTCTSKIFNGIDAENAKRS